MNLHRTVNNLLPDRVFRHSSHSLGVLGVLAREKWCSEKKSPEKCASLPLFFHGHHTLDVCSEPKKTRYSERAETTPCGMDHWG
jgi:hypothetical protein